MEGVAVVVRGVAKGGTGDLALIDAVGEVPRREGEATFLSLVLK